MSARKKTSKGKPKQQQQLSPAKFVEEKDIVDKKTKCDSDGESHNDSKVPRDNKSWYDKESHVKKRINEVYYIYLAL